MKRAGVKRQAVLVATMALVALWATRATALVLDDFNDSAILKQADGTEQRTKGSRKLKQSGPLTGVVGGSREVTVNLTDAPPSNAVTAGAWVDPSVNRINFSSTVGTKGSLELRYDANGKGFTQEFATATALRLDIDADVSAVPYQVILTATDKLGRTMSASRQGTLAGVQRVEIPLKDLTGINFKKLLSIVITITPGASGDVEIRQIETVDAGTN